MRPLNPAIKNWRGRRVWIVGASSGIGEALALKLRDQGATLALSARNEDALKRLASDIDLAIPLDVTDANSVMRAKDRILQQWQDIDLVIYAAGTYAPMRSWEIDLSRTREIIEVNLLGAFNLIAATIPQFVYRNSGAIALIASVAGYTGLPKALAYGPTKAAMINLAQVMYSELAPKGIGVYLINPGFVDTRLTKQNDFEMPGLITTQVAAESILTGISKGLFEIHFPKGFTRWMKLLKLLPNRPRFYLLKKIAGT